MGALRGREDRKEGRRVTGLGRVRRGGGIIAVKPLFPPGKKKEVNDTLELLTHTHHPSLSFMEGRCDTLFSVAWRPGRQPRRPAITKREKEVA